MISCGRGASDVLKKNDFTWAPSESDMGATAQRIARAAIGGSQKDEGAVFGKAGAIAAAVKADSRGRGLISRHTVHFMTVPVR